MRFFPGVERFYKITPHVYGQCCFVYMGEAADKAGQIDWPATHIHSREPREGIDGNMLPATKKLYLVESGRLLFPFGVLVEQADALGIRESWIEWNFLRNEGEARIACMRQSEGIAFGFGRPHPFKPHFKPNPLFAGPLVDYRPGTKEGWQFEPVWMNVKPAQGEGYYLRIEPRHSDGIVTLMVGTFPPSAVPEKLAAYEFSRKRQHISKMERFVNRVYGNIQHGRSR